jgi:RNA polymerase sigma factor (TIGR02999 family)
MRKFPPPWIKEFANLHMQWLFGVTSGKLTLWTSGGTFALLSEVVPRQEWKLRRESSSDITRLLADWSRGDEGARDTLIPLVYDELRLIARRKLARERPDHSLQRAALVDEAYLRLVRQKTPDWQNRAHFFGVAAQMMRHILVDHARNRRAAKRGAGAPQLRLAPWMAPQERQEVDLVALDSALNKLATMDPQQCRVIELRFFGGLSIEEAAVVMGVSTRTVERSWTAARAWLCVEMTADARR